MEEIKIGIGVMIFKDKKILFKKRKTSHGTGEWSFPGGHLEYMESYENCAKRETLEESGIYIKNIRLNYLANLKTYTPKHYVAIELIADWESGEPQVLEPEKNETWEWFDLDNLPSPLFKPCMLAVESYKTGRINYYDNVE